jgi:hypothetical protein
MTKTNIKAYSHAASRSGLDFCRRRGTHRADVGRPILPNERSRAIQFMWSGRGSVRRTVFGQGWPNASARDGRLRVRRTEQPPLAPIEVQLRGYEDDDAAEAMPSLEWR